MPRQRASADAQPPKLQRWVDLIAALLARKATQTFEELARQVPAYTGGNADSVKRMFERDKLELRALGLPIETIGEDGDEDTAYRLRTTDFYLPYLSVVTARGTTSPARVDRYGYRALSQLAFDPDELAAVAEAAGRVRQLGDRELADDVETAMRKLAFDLPMDLGAQGHVVVSQPLAVASPEILRKLSAALVARKRVTLDYFSMSSQSPSSRDVEPFGLFFLNAHWYLAARERGADAVKNFRVSRTANAKVNTAGPGTPDFVIPRDFDLRAHARSKQAWEIGADVMSDVIVEIRGTSGATEAAALLGESVPGRPMQRRFAVRRPEVFARWLLSFAGEIVPVLPPELVAEYHRQIADTLELYADARHKRVRHG
jgi:proteasome accessory factor B